MPIYEYECPKGHLFDSFNSIECRHDGICPRCGQTGKIRITRPSFRIANPILWLTSDGQEIARKPDSGISPPVRQPYPVGG